MRERATQRCEQVPSGCSWAPKSVYACTVLIGLCDGLVITLFGSKWYYIQSPFSLITVYLWDIRSCGVLWLFCPCPVIASMSDWHCIICNRWAPCSFVANHQKVTALDYSIWHVINNGDLVGAIFFRILLILPQEVSMDKSTWQEWSLFIAPNPFVWEAKIMFHA